MPDDPSRHLPAGVRSALPPDAAKAWQTLARHLPEAMYLGGGAAAAVHLHHRLSQDLDFFFHAGAVDLAALEATLAPLGFAVTYRGPGTLRGILGATKVEFFHADETGTQHLIDEPQELADIRVAGLRDIMAMKLKVLAERGELRDYYDVMRIEQDGHVSLEDGIADYLDRYGLDRASAALAHLIRALGYLDDADDDESLPVSKADLTTWWRQRQSKLVEDCSQ